MDCFGTSCLVKASGNSAEVAAAAVVVAAVVVLSSMSDLHCRIDHSVADSMSSYCSSLEWTDSHSNQWIARPSAAAVVVVVVADWKSGCFGWVCSVGTESSGWVFEDWNSFFLADVAAVRLYLFRLQAICQKKVLFLFS